MKINERNIQSALYSRFCEHKQHRPVVPNYYFMNRQWESDLISVTKTLLVHEFEIKCTKSDFKNDFKNKKNKHKDMNHLKIFGYNKNNASILYMPNYFWFVCPEGLIEKEDIPPYSGWIEIQKRMIPGRDGYEWLHCNIIKNAPRLHTEKISEKEIQSMATSLMYKYWRERIKK